MLVAFLLAWTIEERPLRQTVDTAGVGEAFAAPKRGDSLSELTRELAQLVGRDRTRAFIERTVDAAGLDLCPGAAWLLVQADAGNDPRAVAAERAVDGAWVDRELGALTRDGLLDGEAPTDAGRVTAARLVDARRECLRSLVADWSPDEDPRVNDAIERLAAQLAHEEPASVARAAARA